MKFDINKYFIDDVENENHPSVFESTKNYSIFIIRLPYIKEHKVDVKSYAFLIKDKIYIYNRKTKEFNLLGDFDNLYKFIDIKIDRILAKLAQLDIEIANMEDKIYDGTIDKNFANRWLIFKKELVLIERLLDHFLISFRRFMRHYKDKIELIAFKDLEEHIERALRYSINATKKLDYLYNFYTAKMSNKMNNIIFFLTIISSIFLPLTLLTGFFGMNTGGLPFAHDQEGTLKATTLFVILEIPFIFILWQLIKKQ